MAQDPLAMVYGGQIGQGQAQVFDTSGLAKQVIIQQKEKDKAFLDSIIDLDTSKVWNQDLPEYNKMWDKYRDYVSENYKALSNPSRNVDIWSEKKRMEQEMLNFVSTSHTQHKEHLEFTKSLKTVNNDGNLKWNQTTDENEFLKDGTTANPNYGRALSDLYKEMSLSDRSNVNIWDLKTAVQKDIAPKLDALYTKLSARGGAGSVIEFSEKHLDDGKGGKIIDIKQTVDVDAWDRNIVEYYKNNPTTRNQINNLYEQRKKEAGGELYMPLTYWDEDKNMEVTEDMLIENGEQYFIASSRARIPKGSIREKFSKPAQYNFRSYVNINTEQQEEYVKSTPELQTSGANYNMLGGEFTAVGVTYKGGKGSKRTLMISPQGTILSNSGNNYTGTSFTASAIQYTEQNGEYGLLLQRDSKFAKDKETELKAELKDLRSSSTHGYLYVKADESGDQYFKGNLVYRDKGQLIDNPRIKEIEGEISNLGPTDVDESVWMPLKDKQNIIILQDLIQDKSMTYADVVKLFEGSSKEEKKEVLDW